MAEGDASATGRPPSGAADRRARAVRRRDVLSGAAGAWAAAPLLAGLLPACGPLGGGPLAIGAVDARRGAVAARARALVPELERALRENVLGFWLSRSLDHERGGYRLDYGPHGAPSGNGSRGIVGQARQMWFFARLARAGYGGAELLAAAELGYRFLREWLWDAEAGGFYWEVAEAGRPVRRPDKHLYGQAFGLYALAEYYLASGQREALDLADRLFALLDQHAHDGQHGGYHEFLRRDWSAPASDAVSYRGPIGLKTLDTHLHLLEALTTYYQTSRQPQAYARLIELILIQSSAVVRKDPVVFTEMHDPDWTPRAGGTYSRLNYGHHLEGVWLLLEACSAAGLPLAPLLELCAALTNNAVRGGYDELGGGFYLSGPLRGRADERAKAWWVQAEALVGALTMYHHTHDPTYFAVFERTWEFTRAHLIDWERGEWHHAISPGGRIYGDKGDNFKTGYHTGRALVECLDRLRALG